jgi:hypothetical protein
MQREIDRLHVYSQEKCDSTLPDLERRPLIGEASQDAITQRAVTDSRRSNKTDSGSRAYFQRRPVRIFRTLSVRIFRTRNINPLYCHVPASAASLAVALAPPPFQTMVPQFRQPFGETPDIVLGCSNARLADEHIGHLIHIRPQSSARGAHRPPSALVNQEHLALPSTRVPFKSSAWRFAPKNARSHHA